MKQLNIAITGAFGYSGKHISKKLLDQGVSVKTLTNSLQKNVFENKISIAPLSFNNQIVLEENLSGIDVLINTYWVRFNHQKFSHNQAVKNTKILFDAAKAAGVKKIIHVSITNPDEQSDLEYFSGKGILENHLKKLGIKYAIVRPAVLFGGNDILINNIAWIIRKLPIVGVFGNGEYKLQPIHIEDFADVILEQINVNENTIINAIGPETFTYKQLFKTIMLGIGVHKKLIESPPMIGYSIGKLIGYIKNDVTITQAEIKGLMQNKLFVNDTPKGKIKLTSWVIKNRNTLGKTYASELNRRK